MFNSTEFGHSEVHEKKESFLKNKKLVLVLDLDHTLVHSKEMELTKEMKRHPKYRKPGIQLVDPLKSIYNMWTGPILFVVKLRPFFVEFMEESMKNFEIYFYTAGTRFYGNLILDVLKLEIQRFHGEKMTEKELKQLDHVFSEYRSITRDDKSRFSRDGHVPLDPNLDK